MLIFYHVLVNKKWHPIRKFHLKRKVEKLILFWSLSWPHLVSSVACEKSLLYTILNLKFSPEKVKPALVGDLTCNNYPSMLQGVSAAQKPFHGLPRMQQFDMMRKIMAMRTELSVKFESLRRAQMAIQRSKVIQDTIMRDGSGVPSSSGSYLPGTISTLYPVQRR